MFRLIFIILLAAATWSSGNFTVRHEPGEGRIEIYDGSLLVATYSYFDEKVKRPHFSNIKAPNGIQVTRHWPPREGIDAMDHDTMHPGIWMAFGKINDGDFWRNKSEIRHGGFFKEPEVSDDRMDFTVENIFRHEDRVLCTERARHSLLRLPHGYLFQFDSTFLAVEPVQFGDQQEMGVGIRMATPLRVEEGSGQILNSRGHINESEGWGRRADWCDYSGLIRGKQTGAMLMPDPRNFRPSRFHSRDYGFTAANPFADQDFGRGEEQVKSIKTGKRLRLRFGVYVYSLTSSEALDHNSTYRHYLKVTGYPGEAEGMPWLRHTIDAGSRGADGVRLGDINGDGLPDIASGWEQGSEVRVYLNPGPEKARDRWSYAVAGQVKSPEDAVFIDLNHDGQLDVVSSTEGGERTVYAHFSPSGPSGNLTASPWITLAFPALQKASQWMFALPLQIDQKRGVDLVVGSKGASGQIGWLQAPENGELLADWKWHRLAQADWVMSLRSLDLNGDGLTDIAFSQRNGPESGIWWLENPGPERLYQPWKKRYVAGKGAEVMFMDYGDLNADGWEDFIAATRDGDLVAAYRERAEHPRWKEESIPMPGKTGTGKAVAIGHIDGDGVPDLVVTCENSENATGVFWMKRGPMGKWEAREISGREEGVKFDRIELIDLDGDNDLDVLTCEERHNLGVIWYENPAL